ncbi:MAG TPA: hypothetical protein VFY67_20400 [Pyrinomonadaceae bacterium]|nr:hypothetical protein [Pyrinomonadaceae bacterium]
MKVVETTGVFTILVAICVVTCQGQSVDEFRSVLQTKAGLSGEELVALDRGETVVKVLAPANKREVALCGAVRLHEPPELIARMFQQATTQNNKSVVAKGRFSNPPSLTDVEHLTLDGREIADIRECVIGDCALKLSAAMIDRFRREIDWSSDGYRTQVMNLFRGMLVDYVREYLLRGNIALIKYDDQDRQVSVEQEQESLLEGAVIFNTLVPELKDELRSFPASTYGTAQHSISWGQVKFGLKPVVILTHTTKYIETDRAITVSRQIYASHYLDSSLVITGAFRFPSPAKEQTTYFLYTSYTRADALDGAFGKLKRNISQSQAADKITELLNQTRLNLGVTAENELKPPSESVRERIVGSFLSRRRVLWGLVGLVVLALFIWLVRSLRAVRSRRLIGD